MSEAVACVKRELGREAVILSTRTVKRGGLLGFGGRQVVQVTASNEVSIVPPRMRRARRDAPAPESRPATHVLQRAYGSAAPRTPAVAPPAPQPQHPPAERPQPAPLSAEQQQINDEIRQIRRMVDRMMKSQSTQPRPDVPDALFDQYLALLEQEVTEELAEEVVQQVRQTLSDDQLNDAKAVRRAVSEQVAQIVPVDAGALNKGRADDGRPTTIALIGPTGVGKTTTLAKLAATLKLREKKNVALVTIDTYRIAAVDQLKTYADIIDLPLAVVLSPAELGAALERFADRDVVLIDTAGRSQRDDEKLQQLQAFLEVADPHEVHLVLSSTCSQKVMMEAVERFSTMRIDRIIFTKLDEAVSFGVVLNVVRRVNKQLSYITTGQEVPQQIEPGRSDRMAELILGGRL